MCSRAVLASLTLLIGCGSVAAPTGSSASGGSATSGGNVGVGGVSSAQSAGATSVTLGGSAANDAGSGGAGAAPLAGAPNNGGAAGSAGNAGHSGGSAGHSGGSAGSAGSAGGGSAGSAGGGSAGGGGAGGSASLGLPSRAGVIEVLRRANTYFTAKWPNPGQAIDSSHASHIWTRAVYYEGLIALYGVDPKPSDLSYALDWAKSHNWGIVGGTSTRSADNQCAGQTYLALYELDPQPERIADIKTDIDRVVAGTAVDDWTWIDAIQMAMPVFAKLGVISGQAAYHAKMYALYSSSKNSQGAAGFYSKSDHLWWRDANYDPPYTEPNGKNCYWSRGNGWVFAALTRVLDIIPESETHRAEYLSDFSAMAEALLAVQRSDGFWNVSLQDPTYFGGPELTGTSLFTYGMAWGVRKGILPAAKYGPAIQRAWTAMASAAHDDGFLGYVQGTGKEPADGQPVTFDEQPNFEDFGLGCFLLGGSEVARLAPP